VPLSSKCKPNWSQLRDSPLLHRHWYSWLYAYRARARPRPNDIYALGIIGIQALTKMSPMQLQTLEDPLREESFWQLVSPVGRVLSTTVLPLQRPYQSAKETLQRCSNTQWLHPYRIREHNMPLCLLPPQAPISGHNNVSTSDNHSETPGSRNGQAAGASSPRQWSLLVGSGIAAVVIAIGVSLAFCAQYRSEPKPEPPFHHRFTWRQLILNSRGNSSPDGGGKKLCCASRQVLRKCCRIKPVLRQVLRPG